MALQNFNKAEGKPIEVQLILLEAAKAAALIGIAEQLKRIADNGVIEVPVIGELRPDKPIFFDYDIGDGDADNND